MVELIIIVVVLVIFTFGIVVFFGAPFLPTFDKQAKEALDILDLKKGDKMIELGCGDGRVMLLALERGYKVVGYELNPVLALIAWLRTQKYGSNSKVIWGSFWNKNWPESQGLYVFLHTKFMKRLDKKLAEQVSFWRSNGEYTINTNPTLKVVSYAFEIPGKRPELKKGALIKYIY
jgi:16S rRNA A1518/A1519 N6-dimethyltransferase RsmA/KsgA/DIM1 with predicted DNA glycosylase/AP lyase activity